MSLRTLLRDTTAPAHTAIESNVRLSSLTSTSLSSHAYREILEKYYGFFRPIENELRASSVAHEAVPALEERFKASELVEDLLGLGLTAQEIEELPFCRAFPSLSTRASILGVMYVLEGSALGGMLIAKHLATLPWYRPGAFFHTEGAAVSARWKSFLAALEGVPESDWHEVADTALATFKALDAWMAG